MATNQRPTRPRPPRSRLRAALRVALLGVATLAGTAGAADVPGGHACCGYTLAGAIWYDENGNGVQDPGEPPLPGWTVNVYDAGSALVGSTVTDFAGLYSFYTPVACGTVFTLEQVVQPGWSQTFPAGGGGHTDTGVGCGDTLGVYAFGNVDDGCAGFSQVYTLDADFNLGVLSGVVTNSDQLELSPTATTWPYAWIANAHEGTLSKVDTQTGKEVARYFTGPPDIGGFHSYLSPSRTVIDEDGNCWVANRTAGDYPSVTQVVTSGGDDRNLNSIIDTSNDANSNGIIEPSEMLPWGQDERVKRHYLLGSLINNPARGMVIDKSGLLWVGLSTSLELVQVDPTLPIATYAPNLPPAFAPSLVTANSVRMPYGLALSPSGLIYMSTRHYWAYEFDPGLASGGTAAGPAMTDSIFHAPAGNYGIAVDRDCNVWLASNTLPVCIRWDTGANTWTLSGAGAPSTGRGITIDFNNEAWMSCTDPAATVVKYANAPAPPVIGAYPTPTVGPLGVGAASDGHIVVTGGTPPWCKLNSGTGAVMPLAGPTLAGLGPYTYSDFTGSLTSLTALQQGTWTVVTDGGSPSIVWTLVSWTPTTPPGTSVEIEARAAQTLPILAASSWTTIGAPGPLGSPMPGRYLETRARLQRTVDGCSAPFVTPILHDLTVEAICDTCEFVSCPPDTTIACESGQGAVFEYSPPVLASTCDNTFEISCTPPSGSVFPIGTTPVVCTAVSATGDTAICQFNVTVLAGCDPTPTGACCLQSDCTETTEHDCLLQGGVYFGDGSDCSVGCDYDCIPPPHHMVGWWTFDTVSGGKTPNLANPSLPGALVGGATALPGERVNGALEFDGASQYVEVPDSPTLALGAGDFSIDAWVKTSAAGVQPIMDKRGGTPTQGFALALVDGYPALQLVAAGAAESYALSDQNGGPAAFVADGQWHLVAVSVDRDHPAGVQFYVDGARVGTTFDPTAAAGSLDNAASLRIAGSHPLPTARFFDGALDEVELIQSKVGADKIAAIFAAGPAGKCPELCYATQMVPCCQGFTAWSAVTICNFDVVSHVYSYGLGPLGGGAGCGPTGPTSFIPSAGTVTVGPGSCVTVPIAIGCPTSVPVGQVACYQVSLFNHDTGRLFACRGSVRITKKWCVEWAAPFDPPNGIVPIAEGQSTPFHMEVRNVSDDPGVSSLDYTLRPLAGGCCDRDDPSTALALNGLPPGEPVIGSLMVAQGGSGSVPFDLEIPTAWLVGYERLAVYGDDDGDGADEKIGEIAVRSVPTSLVGVPALDPSRADAPDPVRLFVAVPNPFVATGSIRFRVPGSAPERVRLRLFDLGGRSVREFRLPRTLEPGEHAVPWDQAGDRGGRLDSGLYFMRLDVGGRTETVKVVVRR